MPRQDVHVGRRGAARQVECATLHRRGLRAALAEGGYSGARVITEDADVAAEVGGLQGRFKGQGPAKGLAEGLL